MVSEECAQYFGTSAAPLRSCRMNGSPTQQDLETRAALAACISKASMGWGSAKTQLILSLLEAWTYQLTALHAEIVLRWRMNTPDVPQAGESLSSLQPLLLKSALAQDAASNCTLVVIGGPAVSIQSLLGTPVQASVSGSNTSATKSTPQRYAAPSEAWQQCALQLNVGALLAQLSELTQDKPASQQHIDRGPPSNLSVQPLESEPGQQKSSESLVSLTPSLREQSPSPLLETRPHGFINARTDRTASSGSGQQVQMSALPHGSTHGLRPMGVASGGGGDALDSATGWGFSTGLVRLASPAISENSGTLPTMPFALPSAARAYAYGDPVGGGVSIPEDRAVTCEDPPLSTFPCLVEGDVAGAAPEWSAASTLSSSYAPLSAGPIAVRHIPDRKQSSERDVTPQPHHLGYGRTEYLSAFSIGSQAAFDSVLGTSVTLPAGSFAGSFQMEPFIRLTQSTPGHTIYPAAMRSHVGAMPTTHIAHPSAMRSRLVDVVNAPRMPPDYDAGRLQPTAVAQAARGQPLNIPRSTPVQLAGGGDDGDQAAPGVVGTLDLDSALEAIITYESSQQEALRLGAARASAAHNTLQQHVAAAVRAADHASSSRATGLKRSMGALGLSFAAKQAQQTVDSGSFPAASPGTFGVTPAVSGVSGSAPSASIAVIMQSKADAQAAYATPASAGHLTSRRSASLLVEAGQRAPAESGMTSTPTAVSGRWLGPAPVSISAPRPIGDWPPMSNTSDTVHAQPMSGATAASAAAMAQLCQSQQLGSSSLEMQTVTSIGAPSYVPMWTLTQIPSSSNISQPGPSSVADMDALSAAGSRTLWARLSRKMRTEVQQMLQHMPNVKPEQLDDTVLYQLLAARQSESGTPSSEPRSGPLQPLFTHGAAASPSRCPLSRAILPTASKQALLRLPARVISRMEEVVARVEQLKWAHFDAGVIKVLGQLTEMSEADVLEELQLLEATDLSSVEYMPAYLNKRLNNRLWGRRKMQHMLQ